MWAFKSFLYTNRSFVPISAGFAVGNAVGIPARTLPAAPVLVTVLLVPIRCQTLIGLSPVPGISRRTREYQKPELVWLFWDALSPVGPTQKGQTGCSGAPNRDSVVVLSQVLPAGIPPEHCSSLGCRMSIHRQQLLPQTCRVLQHVCVSGHLSLHPRGHLFLLQQLLTLLWCL